MRRGSCNPLSHILLIVTLVAVPLAVISPPNQAGAEHHTLGSAAPAEELSPNPGADRDTGASWSGALQAPSAESKSFPKLEGALSDLFAEAESRGAAAAIAMAPVTSVQIDDGQVRVVIELEDERLPEIGTVLESVGGREESSYGRLAQALVPVERLRDLAAEPGVRFLRRPLVSVPLDLSPATISEGVSVVNASAWQAGNFRGQNVKIAVVDAGFLGWQDKRDRGELPSNVITRSFRANGDLNAGSVHGAAVAEIVHDMAPAAQLYLVNYGSEVELGNAVSWLADQGVKIISCSMGWINAGPGDGTGVIDDIVNTARSRGILWVNSAGNHAQRHWEGSFVDDDRDEWHNFTPIDEGNSVYLYAGQQFQAFLSWNDWPGSSQDYDLFLRRASGQNVAWSRGSQTGTQAPTESITFLVDQEGWYTLAIQKYSATRSVYFELFTTYTNLEYQSPDSSLLIPADSPNALTVGAMGYDLDELEPFSSRGPTNDGRTKPDLAAPDGVSTATYNPSPFYGTSASAPHVAGAAALVLGAFPTYTPAQVQAYLEGRARDFGTAGKDSLYGSGRLDLWVWPGAVLSASPTRLSFMGERSGTYLSPATLRISAAGSGTLSWTATPNSVWLSLSSTSGSVTSPSSTAIYVTVLTPTLSVGAFDSSVSLTASPGSQTIDVPVQVILVPDGQLRRAYLPMVLKSYSSGW